MPRVRRRGHAQKSDLDILEVLLCNPANFSESENAEIEHHLERNSNAIILVEWRKERARQLAENDKRSQA